MSLLGHILNATEREIPVLFTRSLRFANNIIGNDTDSNISSNSKDRGRKVCRKMSLLGHILNAKEAGIPVLFTKFTGRKVITKSIS